MSFDRFQGTARYLVDDRLRADVNAAIALGRPLLIKGEPGTGKTALATAVAENLGMKLHAWHIKSTTKAEQGLYFYDVVARLNDSRFGDRDISDVSRYIRYGVLGRAFQADARGVVLIDEIDKADIEFPNDLLRELDEMKFYVHELDRTIEARHRPVVIITSNAEKDLPDAFLRRCVFHYIDFPEPDRIKQIVALHHPDLATSLLEAAVIRFYDIRNLPGLRKRPATSELIDWLTVLVRAGIPADQVARSMPFLGVLIKEERDIELVRKKRR